jgi:acyl-CoA dehydrogenase
MVLVAHRLSSFARFRTDCMRMIGMAERGLEELLRRVQTRTAFGGLIAGKGAMLKDIADCRIEIDSCRLLCLQAASMMDTVGNKLAAQQIGMIKVLAPNMCLDVLDRAIQSQGGRGVCQDTPLPWFWAGARTLRLADGPDEVHRENIAKLELLRAKL